MSTYAVTSEVLDTATVLQVVVEDAALTEWELHAPTGLLQRTGTVTLRLADVLAGDVTDPVGTVVTVPVLLLSPQGARPSDVHGLWAHLPADAGARLVAFSDPTPDLTAALTEPLCHRLTPSGPVLADLRLALRLKAAHPTADRLLAAAEQHRADAGGVFARYVWVAAREALRTDAGRFDRLMSVADDPATRAEAQLAYLVSAYEDVTFSEAFPDGHRARLARAMLRSALDERLATRRHDLLAVYLPNLLSVPEPLPADDVLGPDPGLRDAVRAELADPRDPTTTSPALRAWLGEG
ncbi:hypothetical protein [Georgenia sp. H159]|uniref:hypothetical protein n=1 Tax=Georgenia sp. H159 TaxID=3076115 RepID=UPI002D784BF0|nr:hypothetical protein [Georgenia sp. H159]